MTSQKVRIIIAEDETLIAEGLRVLLESQGFEVVAIFETGTDLLAQFFHGMADVLFMDIFLAKNTNGIETAAEIKKSSDIPIIYITKSEDDYLKKKAINDTNAVHYITKPFNRREISIALEFALRALRAANSGQETPVTSPNTDIVFLKNGLGYKKISIADIAFLQADRSYCNFVFKDGKTQLFTENLSYFEQKLGAFKDLLRIHRSYIVNLNAIDRVHENRLWINGVEIPIGRSYRTQLFSRFKFV